MVITRTLKSTGENQQTREVLQEDEEHPFAATACSEVFRSTWCTQKSIVSATSILSSTAISSISFWSAIQATICVFDCSMETGFEVPVLRHQHMGQALALEPLAQAGQGAGAPHMAPAQAGHHFAGMRRQCTRGRPPARAAPSGYPPAGTPAPVGGGAQSNGTGWPHPSHWQAPRPVAAAHCLVARPHWQTCWPATESQRALPQARTGRVGQLRPVTGHLGTQALAGGVGQHHAPRVSKVL